MQRADRRFRGLREPPLLPAKQINAHFQIGDTLDAIFHENYLGHPSFGFFFDKDFLTASCQCSSILSRSCPTKVSGKHH